MKRAFFKVPPSLLLGFLVGVFLVTGYTAFAVWTSPSAPPPGGGVSSPIHTGPGIQTKENGDIIADNLAALEEICIGLDCISSWIEAGGGVEGGKMLYDTPGDYTFNIPSGVTEVYITAIGGGAGGAGGSSSQGSAQVPAEPGTSGETSSFGSFVVAQGGNADGTSGGPGGGDGGSAYKLDNDTYEPVCGGIGGSSILGGPKKQSPPCRHQGDDAIGFGAGGGGGRGGVYSGQLPGYGGIGGGGGAVVLSEKVDVASVSSVDVTVGAGGIGGAGGRNCDDPSSSCYFQGQGGSGGNGALGLVLVEWAGGGGAGGGVSGREVVSQNCNPAGNCSVQCPVEKVATGGGCRIFGGPAPSMRENRPSGNGWYCSTVEGDSDITAYAVCVD